MVELACTWREIAVSGTMAVAKLDAWRRDMLGTESQSFGGTPVRCVGTHTVGRDPEGRRIVRILYLGLKGLDAE